MDNSQDSRVGCGDVEIQAISAPASLPQWATALVARLRNDRYSLDHDDNSPEFRRAWNASSEHVETVIVPAVIHELRVLEGLTEFRRQCEWLAADSQLVEMQEAML